MSPLYFEIENFPGRDFYRKGCKMANYLIHYEGEQTDISGNYLVHHGILGQKWGVRRFQNYDGTLIKSSEAEYHRYRTGKKKKFDDSKSKSGMSAFISNRDNSYSFKTTLVDRNGNRLNTQNMGNTEYDVWYSDKHFATSDTDLDVCNMFRDKGRWNGGRLDNDAYWSNNCVATSLTLINRKKGFNVAAGPMIDGIANEAVGYYYDGTKRQEPSSIKDLKSMCSKPNTYGVFATRLANGCGHMVEWETDSNGNTLVHDGQQRDRKDQKFSFDGYFDKYGFDFNSGFGSCCYDLTNATPNLGNQAEDHIFLPIGGSSFSSYNRVYNGVSKEDHGSSITRKDLLRGR